ncbi:hypothetical protein ACF08M_01500 [Streptomyces sp. NPDC015032]|uniref:hypothetical protein n=1 Tax=Streptomyces sp. NPDC015032 TaxID=3364937 RepID=UPI0037002138
MAASGRPGAVRPAAAAALRVVSCAPADAVRPEPGERLGPRQRADALRLLGNLEQLLREPCRPRPDQRRPVDPMEGTRT